MAFTVNLTVGPLLHAVQPNPFVACDPSISFRETFTTSNHSLCCHQASHFTSVQITHHKTLANAKTLECLSLVYPGRLILGQRTKCHHHEYCDYCHSLFHIDLFIPLTLLGNRGLMRREINNRVCRLFNPARGGICVSSIIVAILNKSNAIHDHLARGCIMCFVNHPRP